MATPEPMPRPQAPSLAEFVPETNFGAAQAETAAPHLKLVQNELPFGQALEQVVNAHARQVELLGRQSGEGAQAGRLAMHRVLHELAVTGDIGGYNQMRDEIHQRYLAQRALAAESE